MSPKQKQAQRDREIRCFKQTLGSSLYLSLMEAAPLTEEALDQKFWCEAPVPEGVVQGVDLPRELDLLVDFEAPDGWHIDRRWFSCRLRSIYTDRWGEHMAMYEATC